MLNIEIKEDSAEKLAAVAGKPTKNFLFAPEFNAVVEKCNEFEASKADLVGGKVPAEQLPAYVDDVLEFADLSAFPATGETGKIYLAIDTNKTYRWSGSVYIELGGGANKQIFQWGGGTWTTTNLNKYYYISYNARAIETLPGGTGTTITASMTGRNQGLFIAPFNCKIRRVMLMDSGSGAYSGSFVIASGIPNYGGTWNIAHYNIVIHLNTAISSPGYNKNKFEYLVSDNITVPKGYVVCPMLIFSSQSLAGKLLEILIEIEEVL